jgi:hypothetical protein
MDHMDAQKFVGKAIVAGGLVLAGMGLAAGTAQAFNPQPDPPGRQATAVNSGPEVQSKPGIIAVNPQSRVHIETRAGG